jgi:hypothetical protein
VKLDNTLLHPNITKDESRDIKFQKIKFDMFKYAIRGICLFETYRIYQKWKVSAITPGREIYLILRTLGLLISGDVLNFSMYFNNTEYYIRKYAYMNEVNKQ